MSAVPKPKYSADQYLALEEPAEYRSQFYFGEIFAMAGASRRHNIVAGNIYASIHNQLGARQCEAYQNDMRVKVSPNFYTYPDVIIVCGEPRIEKEHGDNLLNPTVIVEVLSPSTEKFDRGDKFRYYRLMPSVREYLLVSQSKMSLEHYVRRPDNTWLLTEVSEPDEVVSLAAVSCELFVKDVYEKVDFSEEESG